MPGRYIVSRTQFEQHVVLGTTPEGLFIEFKKTVEGPQIPSQAQDVRAKKAKELCRDVTQFANARGGCLLIGIEEAANATGQRVAHQVEPVTDVEGLRQWIEQAITNYCVPSTFTHTIDPIVLPQGTIVAVNVSPSVHPVYVWDRAAHTVELLTRTNHGKTWLNPDEMERHIMDGSRASRLAFDAALARARADADVIVADGIWRSSAQSGWWTIPAWPIRFGARDESTFELKVPIPASADPSGPIIAVALPYGLIDEIWIDVQSRVNLLLSVRLHYDDRDIRLVRPAWSGRRLTR